MPMRSTMPTRRSRTFFFAPLLPIVIALVAVACSGVETGSSTTTAQVTVPSSRPSPGGPTTAIVDDGLLRFERVPVLPTTPFDYSIDFPDYIVGARDGAIDPLDLDRWSEHNPITNAGATLGRVLFYDVNLSRNLSLSCASCHLQSNSFADRTRRSIGSQGSTRRNSMALANIALSPSGRFFADERAVGLEQQALEPFSDPIELNLAPEAVVARIESLDYYEPLFIAAFGDDDVSLDLVASAMAQFMRSMVSVTAPYDAARADVSDPVSDFPSFTSQQNEGKRIFLTSVASGGGGCAGCHTGEAFLSPVVGEGNNGLDAGPTADRGVFEITGEPFHQESFRVPSLRNIAVTGPYMHDGRFRSLDDVIDHYSGDIMDHPNLSERLRDEEGRPLRLSFTNDQKAALIAFLQTLTDRLFLEDERFSDPFGSSR